MATVQDSQCRSRPLSSLNEHIHRIQQSCNEERVNPEKCGREKKDQKERDRKNLGQTSSLFHQGTN